MVLKILFGRPLARVVSIFLVFKAISSDIKAQIPVEVLVGQNQVQHEFFLFRDIDSLGKVNLFSMARFAVDYQESELNTSFISSQATYNFTKNWGMSSGAIYSEKDFAPLVALSYSYNNKKGDLFINLFPTALIKDKFEYEMFGLLFYTPRIGKHLNLFSQIIFGSTFKNSLSRHSFSYQQVRLGIGINDLFQTGFGIDQNLIGPDLIYSNNIGIFIRTEL